METSVRSFKNKLSVLKHAHGILFGEYTEARKGWETETLKKQMESNETKNLNDTLKIQVQEFEVVFHHVTWKVS